MENRQFRQRPVIGDECLARVSGIDRKGRIVSVILNGQETTDIYRQARHVAVASVGDEVILRVTVRGLVVIALLADCHSVPAAHIDDNQGHICLRAGQTVTIETQRGQLCIDAGGDVSIDGRRLTLVSDEDLLLSGWPIRLN